MLNRYAYCRNNPLIYTDPTGLFMAETMAGDDGGQYREGPFDGGSENEEGENEMGISRKGENIRYIETDKEEGNETPGKNQKIGMGCAVSFDEPQDHDNPFANIKVPSQNEIMMKKMEENKEQPQLRALERSSKACGRWFKDGPSESTALHLRCIQPMKCVDPAGNVIAKQKQLGRPTIHGCFATDLGKVCGPCRSRR